MKHSINRKISPYAILAFALAAILLSIFLATRSSPGCNTIETVLTSVHIKPLEGRNYVGFDINKQNLTFGTLLPGAMAKKTVSAEYTKNATAYVWAEGNFSSWVIISPKRFEIGPGAKQEIIFTLLVPSTVKEGEYDGKIVFCYQDK